MSKFGYSIFGKGPQRRKTYTKKVHGSCPTELHQDICNFGATNKSAKLSDGEFYLQLFEEVGYAAGKSAEDACEAVSATCDLVGNLFETIFCN